ncbi:MAG: hypothetical protein WA228_12485, partial [Desulfobaccales bacterium]
GVQYAIASPQDLALPAIGRWLVCGALALALLGIGFIQIIIDFSRGEIHKTRLACRFGGAAAVLGFGALGSLAPLNLLGLLALVGGLQVVQEICL